jgi:hypothetical protein
VAIFTLVEIATTSLGALQGVEPVGALPAEPGAGALKLQWTTRGEDRSRAVAEVSGIGREVCDIIASRHLSVDDWNAILSVRVVPENGGGHSEQPVLWGRHAIVGDSIVFEPRFPLDGGRTYRATFDPGRLAATVGTAGASVGESLTATPLVADHSPPAMRTRVTTRITEVYPTDSRLPENLLRFYIVFTAPMARGEAYSRIHLVDLATGKLVDSPFLELDEELWTNDGRRFTLLLDPGRVKRGLKPRDELGPVLRAGGKFCLVVDAEWPDATGKPLGAGYRKKIDVLEPDETSPKPHAWLIKTPPSDSYIPLIVALGGPLDFALANRLIWVEDVSGKTIKGRTALEDHETRWEFTPEIPWGAGDYRLVVGTELEDVAGNSVARPFEVDLAGPISERVTATTVKLPFRVGASAGGRAGAGQ